MSCAPAESFGVVESICPSAGLVSGMPALAVTWGMFLRPLEPRSGDEVVPSRHVDAEVAPDLARVDDDADQRWPAAVGEQHGVLAQPVAGPVVFVDDDWVGLVDGEQSPGEVVSSVQRLRAGGQQRRPERCCPKSPPARRTTCGKTASATPPRTGRLPATEAGTHCAGSAWTKEASARRASSPRPARARERTRSASRSSARRPFGNRRPCSATSTSALAKSWLAYSD